MTLENSACFGNYLTVHSQIVDLLAIKIDEKVPSLLHTEVHVNCAVIALAALTKADCQFVLNIVDHFGALNSLIFSKIVETYCIIVSMSLTTRSL